MQLLDMLNYPNLVALILLICFLNISELNAANILALVVTASPSHHIWNRALMLELAARGHNVTVASPDPEKQKFPNHTDIYLEGMYEEVHANFDYEAMIEDSVVQNQIAIFQWGIDSCRKGLQSKGAKQLKDLAGKQSFDLIIVEAVLDECFLGFIPLFGSPPVMAITAYANTPWAADIAGTPNTPAYISVCNLPTLDHMTFFQRVANFLLLSITTWYRTYVHMPEQDKIAKEFFGEHIPSVIDIEKNISLVLVNIHHSIDYPRPTTPNFIPVGGMHIKPPKKLPKDLQQYIDNAPHGVILFSLGSNVRSDKLDAEKRQAFLDAFAQLDQLVLWKWESDSLPGQPANVRVSKWLPQNDILGHPNVRLFITHGGLLSTQESIYHGVPMVGLPFLADQRVNLQRNVEKGVAEKLDYHKLTSTNVLNTLKQVLDNPSYKEKVRALSIHFRDTPDTSLNTAVWWTEYILRHKGAHHLRSAATNMPWYIYFSIDVLIFLGSCTVILLVLLITLLNRIKQMCVKSNENLQKKKR